MTSAIDRFNPTFALLPIQNNRTAWRSVYLPTVLVIPQMRSPTGDDNPKAMVSDVKFYIEEAPGKAKVSGFENVGLFVPQYERFVKTLSNLELNNYRIDVTAQDFVDQTTGEEKDFSEVVDGDLFYYTTENGDIRDKIVYYKDADYYDLSSISIDTVELSPYGWYNFVWQAAYKERIITPNGELYCISDYDKVSRLSLSFNHPGDVHRSMVQYTPNVYFEGVTLDKDSTVEFYRPFADLIQDVFDEQTFIRGINWVDNIPAQYIPYLAYLIGWDLPYYSGIDDDIRRSFIKNARKLQQLKGSKRAISELFEIFGFTIEIVNLWYRSDGKAFIGPYDKTTKGFENDYVKIENVCTTEPMISNWSESGFGQVSIPLLYRPTDDFTIEAYLASDTGSSIDGLNKIVNDSIINPEAYEQEKCSTTPDGMLVSDVLDNVSLSTISGFSKVLVSYKYGNGTIDIRSGIAPISKNSVSYNKDTNVVSITFDQYIDLSNSRIFVFAVYTRNKITPSTSLADLRSNRFDIRVLLFKDGEQPNSEIYDYLLDFLFKVKAFHSLLRKISYTVTVIDDYNVIDFSVGGINKQSADTDAGNLQVPPAIIPRDITCSSDAQNRGFKDEDLLLRKQMLDALEEEHRAWKEYDGTHEVPGSLRPILESLSRVSIPYPESSPCEYNSRGQNRTLQDPNIDLDHNADPRQRLCDLQGNTKNYVYNGRVKDLLDTDRFVILSEQLRCHPCTLGMGNGIYWHGALNALRQWMSYNKSSWSDLQFSRRAAFGDAIYYSNRSLIDMEADQSGLLAISRPSLEIEKSNMFMPGHRFIAMHALESDYIHSDYYFRPYDDLLNIACPENIPEVNGQPVEIPNLNAKIIVDENGNEWLTFDNIQLKYYGNGLIPDIPSLGHHIMTGLAIEESNVTHTIYSSQIDTATEERPFEFDTIVHTDESSICVESDRKIFNSANESCVCETGGIKDYVDGYPAAIGKYSYDGSGGFIIDTDSIEIAEMLGLPISGSDIPIDLLFKVGSGIRDLVGNKPYRLDCGCLQYGCDSEGSEITNPGTIHVDRCNLQYHTDSTGKLDFNCDQIDLTRKMILSEQFGTCSYRLDGEIPSLFMLNNDKIVWDNTGPVPVGKFKFVDDWGTIHTAIFRISGSTIDITWTTMQPYVWGEENGGFKDDRKVYRHGIITIQRQVIQIVGGSYIIMSEGSEQYSGYFQSNVTCGDIRFIDPFLFHTECGILDQLVFQIKCGPRWSEPSDSSWSSWPQISVDSSGNAVIGEITGDVPFYWIDVWGNEEGGEVTSECQ